MSGGSAETAEARAARHMRRRHWLFAIIAVGAVYGAAFAFLLHYTAPALERQAGAEPALMLELAAEISAPAAEQQAEQPHLVSAAAEAEREEKQDEAARPSEEAVKAQEAEVKAPEKPAPPKKAPRAPKQKLNKEAKKPKTKSAAAPQIAAKNGKIFAAPKTSAEQGVNGRAEQVWADKVYRKILAQARRMQRRLPSASGVAAVRFSYNAAGEIKTAELVQSSGNALLDAAAVKIVKQVSPLPAPPQAGQKTIPVRVN